MGLLCTILSSARRNPFRELLKMITFVIPLVTNVTLRDFAIRIAPICTVTSDSWTTPQTIKSVSSHARLWALLNCWRHVLDVTIPRSPLDGSWKGRRLPSSIEVKLLDAPSPPCWPMMVPMFTRSTLTAFTCSAVAACNPATTKLQNPASERYVYCCRDSFWSNEWFPLFIFHWIFHSLHILM
jgi:hypothetical protein